MLGLFIGEDMHNDTVVALATPPGEGGIAVIRISGDESARIIEKLFTGKKSSRIKASDLKDRYFNYGYITDDEGQIVDEVMMVYMKAPRTYTREDIVEIHCHGGMVPVKRILELVISAGARMAEPGEFTKRAFLNGRIDLSQAEAVMDLISARTEEAAKASIRQLKGSLTEKIGSLRERLLNLLAHIEVTIDYPEEDIEDVFLDDLAEALKAARQECHRLLDSADQGRLVREGIKTVIIGRPNVGKSSLLNALVRENRAIVTDIPGTTRDVIEEHLNIKGVLVKIIDTAGIRETVDLVEKIGVERSRGMMEEADLILFILDASEPLGEDDRKIMEWLSGRRALVLLNKTDKPAVIDEAEVRKLVKADVIRTSMVDGTGIEDVKDYIYNMVFSGKLTAGNEIFITNTRHKEALIRADGHLKDALASLEALVPLDIITIDIRDALDCLGEITGESLTEDLIDKIFAEFCLGK